MPKVLIVDDEPSIRLTLAEFLRRDGFEALVVEDAAQASALLGSGEAVDVAVIDINLPGRSGIDLLRELNGREPYIPVIMITGEPNISQLPELVRAGAYDFIAKPVLKDAIIRAVTRAAEKKHLSEEKRRLEGKIKLYAEELEHRVAERTVELAEAHCFLNLVLDSSTEYAIIAIDMERRITLFNRGAALIFGYSPEETEGHMPRGMFLDATRFGASLVRECLSEAETVMPYQTELLLQGKDRAEFPSSVTVTPIVEGRQRGHLFIIRDLTVERLAEESLREMQARLAHNEKIAELGRVAAQIAHEVRNPLAGLMLYSMHLRNKIADKVGESEMHLADKIVETINHLANTVEQVMSFARPLSLTRREGDLNHVVSEVLQLLKPQIAANRVKSHLNLSRESLRGRFDESSIRSALTNIILNAVQAVPDGGHLRVSTRRGTLSLLIEVADTGVGMTAEEVRNIFEAFYTTKSKGLGLGLPYAKRIIEQHDGEIVIESRPGEGTVVLVRLPAEPESE